MNKSRVLTVTISTAGVAVFLSAWFLNRPFLHVPPPRIPLNDTLLADEVLGLTRYCRREWSSEVLRRFKEAPIDLRSDDAREKYRLILLPTFDAPLMISVTSSPDKTILITKKLDGVGGYGNDKLGELSFETMRDLSESEWQVLREKIVHFDFWYTPTLDRHDEPVNDGAYWVLEGKTNGLIHTVRRINPSPVLGDAFAYITELAGQKHKYDGYYHFE